MDCYQRRIVRASTPRDLHRRGGGLLILVSLASRSVVLLLAKVPQAPPPCAKGAVAPDPTNSSRGSVTEFGG
jgi:hypothetical protein